MNKDQLAVLEQLQMRALETTETMQSVLATLEVTEDFKEGDRVYYWTQQKLMRQLGLILFFRTASNGYRLCIVEDVKTKQRRAVPLKYCILKDSS